MQESRSTESVFVGRERELAELYAIFKDVFFGRGQLVLFAGESGIGKTRLAEEFALSVRQRGRLTLAVVGHEFRRDLLERISELEAGSTREQLLEFLDEALAPEFDVTRERW